jgi:hypothetical protein
MSTDAYRAGIGTRIESSRLGKCVISLFVTAFIAIGVINNLPAGPIRESLAGQGPVANALGLDATWTMFAPDPYRMKVWVYAQVLYSDGTIGRWSMPSGDALVGAYRDVRWLKYQEELRKNSYSGIWKPTAEHVARQERRAGRQPVRITLVRQWYDLLPPGHGPDRGPTKSFAFFSLPLDGGDGA